MTTILSLNEISNVWIDALSSTPEINQYCKDNFGVDCQFYCSGNPNNYPDNQDAPFIMVTGNDITNVGIGSSEQTYRLTVVWVLSDNRVDVDGTVKVWNNSITGTNIKLLGAKELDDMGHLIFQTLVNKMEQRNHPISLAYYHLEPATDFPQWAGAMVIDTIITPAIGGKVDGLY